MGNHRYHIHLVLRDEDFSPAEVRFLWPGGSVDDEPLLLGPRDNYRRTARYFCKERTDGVVLPIGARTWVASLVPVPEAAAAGKEQGRTGGDPRAARRYVGGGERRAEPLRRLSVRGVY